MNDTDISKLKSMLHETDWMVVLNMYDQNFAYDIFLKQFLKLYDDFFHLEK